MYLYLFMYCLSSVAPLTVDYKERAKYLQRSP